MKVKARRNVGVFCIFFLLFLVEYDTVRLQGIGNVTDNVSKQGKLFYSYRKTVETKSTGKEEKEDKK